MTQKDMAEKLLEDYNDVFADIVNVLLFDGKDNIKADELEKVTAMSQYKAIDGRLHEQERDVAKLWKKGGAHILLCGIENQTAPDKDMPLRVISYDGAAYRSQLLSKENNWRYPVITLVLYFGEKRWKTSKRLIECVNIPEYLKSYVNDYKLNIFEISFLTEEQLGKFKSDFGIAADFFVNKRKNKNYIPTDKRKFEHVDAMLKFLSAMTGDERYEIKIPENEKGEVTMCTVLDRAEERGVKRGEEKERTEIVKNMLNAGFTNKQIMEACKITAQKLNKIKREM